MQVLLKRDFKDDGKGYWRRDPEGVEMPDSYRNHLPKDAKILDDEEMTEEELKQAKKAALDARPQEPVALSTMTPKPTNAKGISVE